jgi:hypothetical protein
MRPDDEVNDEMIDAEDFEEICENSDARTRGRHLARSIGDELNEPEDDDKEPGDYEAEGPEEYGADPDYR